MGTMKNAKTATTKSGVDDTACLANAKRLALANATRLMCDAVNRPIEYINKNYGGEDGLLDLAWGYMELFEMLSMHDGTGNPLVMEMLRHIAEEQDDEWGE